MHELCSDMGIAERGRQSALAAQFKVTPNAARKWLLGLGLPETDVAIAIARWAEVNFEWLMTGRGPKQGDKVPTRALIVDEVLRRGTVDDRRELVNFIRYKLDHSAAPLAVEERARYEQALQTYVVEPTKRQ